MKKQGEAEMSMPSVIKQIPVYVSKNYRLFMNQGDWKNIITASFISFLVCIIVGKDMFTTYDDTKSGFFAIISAAIWIGVFNSIQRVCKEHDTITSEYRAGLKITAYVLSHVFFDFVLCLIQSIILVLICTIFIDFPSTGIIFGSSIIEYLITLFLMIWCSDMMGIMISSIASTPNVAMTTMPFVLIMQLVMGGVLFELRGWFKKFAYITFSKWGMSALGSIGDLNSKDLPYKLSQAFPNVVRIEAEQAYDATAHNLLNSWICIVAIGLVCVIISIVSLKIRNRGS
ncbi:ABC transporter permease [Ruminococcus flavefaciens]|uniref:ABC transporter permease n=1 Tax=Ruminococcus flavefaciens TaxID=1265 RepID=UPI0012BB6EFE|nr:ABC transporter permease [Ruminococcus flavefaciens]